MKNILLALIFVCYNVFAVSSEKVQIMSSDQMIINGWYPVFFDIYDQTKVDSIINSLNNNYVKRIVALYDQNEVLVNRVIAGIQTRVNFAVEKCQETTTDTDITRYDHNSVIITVFFENERNP